MQDPPKRAAEREGREAVQTATQRASPRFRVFVVKGKTRISCRKARSVVRAGIDARGYTYFDWTKRRRPAPWSDVWEREDERVVVTAIVNA